METKKNILLFILILFFNSIQASVPTTIDSLIKKIEVVTEKGKPALYNQIAYEYRSESPVKCIEYAEKALVLARKNKNKSAISNALLNKSYGNLYLYQYSEALNYAHEAIKTSDDADDYDFTGYAYNLIGLIFKEQNDYKKALINYQQALKIFLKSKDSEGLADSYSFLGSLYYKQSLYSQAIGYYQKSKQIRESLHDSKGISSSISNLALVFRDKGQYDSALYILSDGLKILETEHNKKEQANLYNLIGSIYLKDKKYKLALSYYNKAVTLREELGIESDLAASYVNLGLLYKELNLHDTSLNYLKKALDLYKELNDKKNIAATLNHIGGYFVNLNMYNEALKNYLESLYLSMELEDKTDIANAYTNIGTIYLEINYFEKAKNYFEEALVKNIDIADISRISSSYILLGNLYLKTAHYDEAINQYRKAYDYRRKIGNISLMAQTLISIGNTCMSCKKYEEALENFNKAYKFYHELSDLNGISNSLNNIGNVYLELKNSNRAIAYFEQAKDIAGKCDNKFNVSLCSRKIGEEYLLQNENSKALTAFENSLEIGKELNNLELIKKGFYDLYLYFNKKSDFKAALNYYILYNDANEKMVVNLYNQDLVKKQIESELNSQKDDIKQKEDEITLLKKEKEFQVQQLERKKNMIRSFILIVILLLIIVYLFYRDYKFKQRTNKLLKEKVEIIEKSNQKLEASEGELKKLNSTKDKFFSIIAHDLKNPLSGLMGLTELLSMSQDRDEISRREINGLIHDSAKHLHNLLENLLTWSRSQTGRITYKPDLIDLYEIAEENIKLLKLNADNKNISLVNHIAPQTKAFADKDMITLVIRNLMSNAIKFTPEHGEIKIIAVSDNEKEIVISVSDNGVGISEADMKKLFRIDTQFTTQGTSKESGTGLGLILCKEFIEKNSGHIWVESQQEKGSQFKFSLPKKNIQELFYDNK